MAAAKRPVTLTLNQQNEEEDASLLSPASSRDSDDSETETDGVSIQQGHREDQYGTASLDSTPDESYKQEITMIHVPGSSGPDDDRKCVRFSLRKLWAFTGPGFLMSIAYLDPGNIESDLQSGATAGYTLLWILMVSTILGFLLQRLAARLGVTTGYQLSELCYKHYPRVPRVFLWTMTEIAIIGSDMQEVIGTAIAFYLLSNKLIPLWAGVIITIFDTFIFLFMDRFVRKLELFFGLLITIMAVTFGYEFFRAGPNYLEILKGLFWPRINSKEATIEQAVGIVGAVIMPHNIYLHSALVRSRQIDRSKKGKIREANFYFFIESAIALFVSFIINMFVVVVFAQAFHVFSTQELVDDIIGNRTDNQFCREFLNSSDQVEEIFYDHANISDFDVDLYKGGLYLGCRFGAVALYIWAVGILAAGESSTMTGTYAGQFVMEGFMNIKWARWKRVFFTRLIAISPTLVLAVLENIRSLTSMNDILNVLQSLQLPFALFPVLYFTNDAHIMGTFKNGIFMKIVIWVLAFAVVAINFFLVVQTIINWNVLSLSYGPYIILAVCVFALPYLALVLYLGYKALLTTLPTSWGEAVEKRVPRLSICQWPCVDVVSLKVNAWWDSFKEAYLPKCEWWGRWKQRCSEWWKAFKHQHCQCIRWKLVQKKVKAIKKKLTPRCCEEEEEGEGNQDPTVDTNTVVNGGTDMTRTGYVYVQEHSNDPLSSPEVHPNSRVLGE